MSPTAEQLIAEHRRRFGHAADQVRLVRSPYRICPLGAHVDHQLGLVTGMTIDAPIWLAYTPNTIGRVRLHSLDFSPPVEFDVRDISAKINSNWGNYARGAAWALSQHAPLQHGFDGVVAGSLPIGGLSSSAAVGIAYLLALEDVNGIAASPLDNVEYDRAIENGYVGLNNGILDPAMILLSRLRHLTALDCQSMAFDHISSPLTDDDFDLVIVYSGAGRMLVNSGYNQRVAECAAAATQLLQRAGLRVDGPPRLRQVPAEVFQAHQHELAVPLRKRATHFFAENERVRRGHSAWRNGDLQGFGALMTQSGESSINNYEAGSPHLITLHDILNHTKGVYGARFAGGGFGGCCIGLSEPTKRGEIIEAIAREYPARHPDVAETYRVFFQKPDGAACYWLAHAPEAA